MIIWSGFGLVAAVVPFFAVIALQVVVYLLAPGAGQDTWHAHNSGLLAVALWSSALVLWFLARRWADPGRVLVDPATGERVTLRRVDSLFFVPLRYWPLILAVGGAVAFADGLFNGRL